MVVPGYHRVHGTRTYLVVPYNLVFDGVFMYLVRVTEGKVK